MGGVQLSDRIHYGDVLTKEIIADFPAKRKPVHILALLTTICVILFILFSADGKVRDILIPGNAEVTRRAVSGFVDDIREGEQVKDALAAFCMEIIENAWIPE